MFHTLEHIPPCQTNTFRTRLLPLTARLSNFPNSRLAILRQYVGIPQQEMADYLGISRSLLANIEANRRTLSRAVHERAAPLLALVPTDALRTVLAPAEPPPALPAAPTPGPLEARHRFCQWRARNLRYELQPLHLRAAVGLRWQAALPALAVMLAEGK